MRIEISGSAISGLLTIEADDSSLKNSDSIDQLVGFTDPKIAPIETVYSWFPWCIVKTDHESWMSIETISSEENSFLEGQKIFQWCQDRFEEWAKVFAVGESIR